MDRILVLLATVLALTACADPTEQITGQELGDKLKRGMTGHGTVGPIDRSDDPYVQHEVPQTHP